MPENVSFRDWRHIFDKEHSNSVQCTATYSVCVCVCVHCMVYIKCSLIPAMLIPHVTLILIYRCTAVPCHLKKLYYKELLIRKRKNATMIG